ncbi:hypothetical protein BOTNAR_1911g00010 [Botryotinia narcissicola]|uniref:Xylanolytic transcriptional activator regulatory domain-containing protein n=1 Tax=Botryotinia narcissicola TaxID=278944 RepID=A0A4Z1H2Z4_9HELO|nr:hypothetical protein BOTNAR_1911g00010 [Botryotinia narcissicola]
MSHADVATVVKFVARAISHATIATTRQSVFTPRETIKLKSTKDRLIRENEQLRRFHSPGRDRSGLSEDSETRALSQNDTAGAAETTLNPVLRDSHWFERIETSETPIWIGEISDAAFATRVRQLITAPQPSNHIPRTHFVPNETLCQIPLAIVFKCWALFALGELYTSRCTRAEETFPGLSAFAHASQSLRVVSERPHLDVVETILLLLNPKTREHRNRLWWTTYVLDRMISSKTGLPVSISDQDITVDPPSDACQEKLEDFMEHSVLVINVNLAKIAGSINQLVYTRKSPRAILGKGASRERRTTAVIEYYNASKAGLYRPKKYDTECWVNLQLTSNQLRIVASRLVLLYIFCHHIATHKKLNIQTQIPDLAQTLAESCVHYARESLPLLVRDCSGDIKFNSQVTPRVIWKDFNLILAFSTGLTKTAILQRKSSAVTSEVQHPFFKL